MPKDLFQQAGVKIVSADERALAQQVFMPESQPNQATQPRDLFSEAGMQPQADAKSVEQSYFDVNPQNVVAAISGNPLPILSNDTRRTILDQGMQGATFSLSDEGMDVLGAAHAKYAPEALGGRRDLFKDRGFSDIYNEARTASQARLGDQFARNPGTSIAANILGGLLTGGAFATTKAGTALSNSLRTGGTLARVGKGSLAGAGSGGLYGFGSGSGAEERLASGASGAVLGGVVGGAIPLVNSGIVLARKGAQHAGRVASNAIDRIRALFGSEGAAANISDDIIAKRLIDEGFTPQQVGAAIDQAKAAGLSSTLGEATGSSGLLQAEKSIVRGTGRGANTMREALADRAKNTIPNALTGFAGKVDDAAGNVSAKYQAASDEFAKKSFKANMAVNNPAMRESVTMAEAQGLNAGPKAASRIRAGIQERLGELGQVRNVESRALIAAEEIMANAEHRGNTFDALLDAKKQLDDLFIEGADAATQKNASRYVSGFTKEINNALEQMAPNTFKDARTSAMAKSAAEDLRDAINSTNEGSLGQLYNKFWAKPEVRQDFLRRLPDDATRKEATLLFNQMEKVRRGFGGSDTAFNLPANRNLANEAGIGFNTEAANPLESAPRLLDFIGQRIQPGVYDHLAKQAISPDKQRIIEALMRRSYSPAPVNYAPMGGMLATGNGGNAFLAQLLQQQ